MTENLIAEGEISTPEELLAKYMRRERFRTILGFVSAASLIIGGIVTLRQLQEDKRMAKVAGLFATLRKMDESGENTEGLS